MSDPVAQEDAAHEEDAAPNEIDVVTPVIVDMGKLSKKKLKTFKKGKGPLMDEVLEILESVALEMGEDATEKVFVPIVMVYEKKEKKKRTIVLPF